MPKGCYPRTIRTFEEKTSNRECIYCSSPLVLDQNWNLSEAKAGIYKCRPCGQTRRAKYDSPENSQRYRDELSQRPVGYRDCKTCGCRLQIGTNWSEACRLSRSYCCGPCRTVANKASRAVRRNKTRHNIDPSADLEKIKSVYQMAETLTKVVGRKYHVDHIKPLSLGGLHHQDNLVVMTASLNQKKHAKHWPSLRWFLPPA